MNTALPSPFTDIDLDLTDRRVGKVRISYALPDLERLFITTDRLSAFDRVVAAIPYKGQVLNELAAWWFANTADIIPNHVLGVPDPNATIGIEASPLPIEVVVRGHITGVTSTALWHRYNRGERTIYGYRFPDGLRQHQQLDTPLITPTTKAHAGAHDDRALRPHGPAAKRLALRGRRPGGHRSALQRFRRAQLPGGQHWRPDGRLVQTLDRA